MGWGKMRYGELGQNDTSKYSSPVQVPGTTWSDSFGSNDATAIAIKTDGTLWAWGYNGNGELGQNNRTNYSSPTQIPGTTWSKVKSR
jgi:alpha-tubulin suppressor-like RCC1 family protein